MITPEKLQTEPIVPYLTQEIISLCDDYIEFWEELKKAFEANINSIVNNEVTKQTKEITQKHEEQLNEEKKNNTN